MKMQLNFQDRLIVANLLRARASECRNCASGTLSADIAELNAEAEYLEALAQRMTSPQPVPVSVEAHRLPVGRPAPDLSEAAT